MHFLAAASHLHVSFSFCYMMTMVININLLAETFCFSHELEVLKIILHWYIGREEIKLQAFVCWVYV